MGLLRGSQGKKNYHLSARKFVNKSGARGRTHIAAHPRRESIPTLHARMLSKPPQAVFKNPSASKGRSATVQHHQRDRCGGTRLDQWLT